MSKILTALCLRMVRDFCRSSRFRGRKGNLARRCYLGDIA